jgi:hypothetical protein
VAQEFLEVLDELEREDPSPLARQYFLEERERYVNLVAKGLQRRTLQRKLPETLLSLLSSGE